MKTAIIFILFISNCSLCKSQHKVDSFKLPTFYYNNSGSIDSVKIITEPINYKWADSTWFNYDTSWIIYRYMIPKRLTFK